MDNGQEPTANDQVIEVTGKPKEELQQMWADFGPDATPFGAGKVEKTITFCTGIGLILKDQGFARSPSADEDELQLADLQSSTPHIA
ncbi:hypothetical protein AK812_SmicGene10011 [Symbiodinium microadriaticum]|uniref:Uncharacterized protein n=1 Tax=Symbiodinium microadriaticum TaxID=2951 RepID=A0A1Q9EH23_SYMMI|nr:hypothetical protein AK812_SmicGene10011 [Symbiodinium microadriaticum]